MKRLLFITLALVVSIGVFADDWGRSRQIRTDELPQTAQNIIVRHFSGLSTITDARQWPHNYTVYLRTGQTVKFNLDGTLKEAKAESQLLPKTLLSEFPNNVSSVINTRYSDWGLVEIEVKRSKIEIELERGRYSADLEFSRTGELLDEDVDD